MLRKKYTRRIMVAGLSIVIGYVAVCNKAPLTGVCVIFMLLMFGMGGD